MLPARPAGAAPSHASPPGARYARAVTAEALAIEVSRGVGESVVVCRGDLDVVTCDRLEDAIEACLETERRALVLDLEGVEFMDSSGFRCLVRAVRRSRKLGVALRILPSTAIRRVFELTAVPIPDGATRPPATTDSR
jgi:anti-sigma B factor antagonist